MLFTPARGPEAAPPDISLVGSAQKAPDANDVRWETGFAFRTECGTYRLIPQCDDPADPYPDMRDGSVYYLPPLLQVEDECTTLQPAAADLDRLRRMVEAVTPYAVARELWTGELSDVDPYVVGGVTMTNLRLASPAATVVAGGPFPANKALGALEQAAGVVALGQRLMLHVPRVIVDQVGQNLYRVGNTLYTPAGSIVVTDAGYPGTGPAGEPAGATVWAYATTTVQVRIGRINDITDVASTVDRSVNRRGLWATRPIAAVFAPCVHVAIEITV
jgi:hypothetical protein